MRQSVYSLLAVCALIALSVLSVRFLLAASAFAFLTHGPTTTHGARDLSFAPTATPTLPAQPQGAVDFGSRQDQSHPIPANVLGVNELGLTNVIGKGAPTCSRPIFK